MFMQTGCCAPTRCHAEALAILKIEVPVPMQCPAVGSEPSLYCYQVPAEVAAWCLVVYVCQDNATRTSLPICIRMSEYFFGTSS